MLRFRIPQLTTRRSVPLLSKQSLSKQRSLARTVFRRRNLASNARLFVKRIPTPLRCAEISGTPAIQKLTASELETAIQDRTVPIIIDFYATWCGPCVMMSQELLKVAERLKDKIRIFKVDTDEEANLSSQLKISGLPTLMFLSSDVSKKSLRLEGMISADDVIKIINNEL